MSDTPQNTPIILAHVDSFAATVANQFPMSLTQLCERQRYIAICRKTIYITVSVGTSLLIFFLINNFLFCRKK